MVNRTVLMGRLTKDPELRRTGSGVAVTSFRIAVERDTKAKDAERPETDFFDCVAWRSTAEFIDKYFAKGRMIVVDGKLRQRGYTTKEGEKRQTVEVEVDTVYFGDSKKSNELEDGRENYYSNSVDERKASDATAGKNAQNFSSGDYVEIEGDDAQLPF